MEPLKCRLTSFISSLLISLKFSESATELTDDFILQYLKLFLDEDVHSLYIKDSLILGTIKEYLYHLLDELGGIKGLRDCSSIVFAGSITKHRGKVILDLCKPKPNSFNVLVGV